VIGLYFHCPPARLVSLKALSLYYGHTVKHFFTTSANSFGSIVTLYDVAALQQAVLNLGSQQTAGCMVSGKLISPAQPETIIL
jgi:hypothetical protein